MSTQAHVKIVNNYETYEDMLWVNHDGYPDVIIPKIKRAVKVIEDFSNPSKKIFWELIEEFDSGNMGNFFTVNPSVEQPMNYLYYVEIFDDAVFLRVQEEYWIEQSEEFDLIPSGYLTSEMRTIFVEQLI